MTRSITEKDWKVFRQLHPIAMDRFCQRALAEVEQLLASQDAQTNHKRYLAVAELIVERNRNLAATFNDVRRSTAWHQLACIQAHKLLTEEEMARFSDETRAAVALFLE